MARRPAFAARLATGCAWTAAAAPCPRSPGATAGAAPAGAALLAGDRVTEADWRLFVTLVRFDAVYYQLFKCNLRRLVDYPNLYGYTRELYQRPGIAETVDMAQIKAHFYGTYLRLNPSRIVAEGPALDFDAPHRRV